MYNIIVLFILNASLLFISLAQSVTLGTVNIVLKANLIEKGCNVSVASKVQTVDLGSWASSYFTFAGKESRKIPFAIALEDCAYVSDVNVILHGVGNTIDKSLLSTTLGMSLAILITDDKGNKIPVGNKITYNITNIISEGKVLLHFNAQYKAMSHPVSIGAANSDAYISVEYL